MTDINVGLTTSAATPEPVAVKPVAAPTPVPAPQPASPPADAFRASTCAGCNEPIAQGATRYAYPYAKQDFHEACNPAEAPPMPAEEVTLAT